MRRRSSKVPRQPWLEMQLQFFFFFLLSNSFNSNEDKQLENDYPTVIVYLVAGSDSGNDDDAMRFKALLNWNVQPAPGRVSSNSPLLFRVPIEDSRAEQTLENRLATISHVRKRLYSFTGPTKYLNDSWSLCLQ